MAIIMQNSKNTPQTSPIFMFCWGVLGFFAKPKRLYTIYALSKEFLLHCQEVYISRTGVVKDLKSANKIDSSFYFSSSPS